MYDPTDLQSHAFGTVVARFNMTLQEARDNEFSSKYISLPSQGPSKDNTSDESKSTSTSELKDKDDEKEKKSLFSSVKWLFSGSSSSSTASTPTASTTTASSPSSKNPPISVPLGTPSPDTLRANFIASVAHGHFVSQYPRHANTNALIDPTFRPDASFAYLTHFPLRKVSHWVFQSPPDPEQLPLAVWFDPAYSKGNTSNPFDPSRRTSQTSSYSSFASTPTPINPRTTFTSPSLIRQPSIDRYRANEVLLNPSDDQYQAVLKLFRATVPTTRAEVVNISVVQNPSLLALYTAMKMVMIDRGTKTNEKLVFHGTNKKSLEQIKIAGFNRSFAGVNGTVYGAGTYFARDASYSLNYSRPDSDKMYYMLVAEILCGTSGRADSSLKSNPLKYDASAQGAVTPVPGKPPFDYYDSAVSSGEDIYVIFHDAQAYPKYVIEFKRCDLS